MHGGVRPNTIKISDIISQRGVSLEQSIIKNSSAVLLCCKCRGGRTEAMPAVKVVPAEEGGVVTAPRSGGVLLALNNIDPDLNNDGKVEPWEQEVYDMMKAADTDGDGNLTRAELFQVVRDYNEGRKGLCLSLVSPDLDNDGKVEKWEQEVYNLMREADTDGDGQITRSELFQVVRNFSEARKQTGQVPLALLNPDKDGDGNLSSWEKKVFNMFKSADVDGSGALSVHEIYTVVGSAASLKKQTGQLKKLLIVAVILIIVLMIGIAAMMVVILDAFKDTKASGAMLTTRDGAVMQTSPSLYPLPLLVAPVMSMAQLDAVQSLTVSYTDPQYISQNGTVQKVRVSAAVGNVVKVNETATYFELDSSDYKKVKVWNGEAQIELHNGNTYDVCESDVTCSALMVEDASQAETFLAQAQEALVNAGYASVAHAAERRRLSAYCVGYQMPDTEATSCLNTCPEHPTWVSDGWCDDGGPGSEYNGCSPGTDCDDCQKRDTIGCSNRCAYARNGVCDDGSQGAATNWCPVGTDCDDCGTGGGRLECSDSCFYAQDGDCDDGGPGAEYSFHPTCLPGTDCTDCGRAERIPLPPSPFSPASPSAPPPIPTFPPVSPPPAGGDQFACAPGSPSGCTATEVPLTGPVSFGRLIKVSGGHDVYQATQENSCPIGWKIFSPATEQDWSTLYDSGVGPNRYGGSFAVTAESPDFLVDVTRGSNGCGGCTRYPMNSMESGQASWVTSDGSSWWLSGRREHEPNGDYSADCYLRIYRVEKRTSIYQGVQFMRLGWNDVMCNSHSEDYFCQPRVQALVPRAGSPPETTVKRIPLSGPYSAGELVVVRRGLATSRSTQPNSCPVGWKIFSPASEQDWQTVIDSVGNVELYVGDNNLLVDVTRPYNGCGGCTGYPMNSEIAQQSSWVTSDGSPWWLRDSRTTEPNGDYSANCYLRVWARYSSNDIRFNDMVQCEYIAARNYLCQPKA